MSHDTTHDSRFGILLRLLTRARSCLSLSLESLYSILFPRLERVSFHFDYAGLLPVHSLFYIPPACTS